MAWESRRARPCQQTSGALAPRRERDRGQPHHHQQPKPMMIHLGRTRALTVRVRDECLQPRHARAQATCQIVSGIYPLASSIADEEAEVSTVDDDPVGRHLGDAVPGGVGRPSLQPERSRVSNTVLRGLS
jgi:hypothetical protein